MGSDSVGAEANEGRGVTPYFAGLEVPRSRAFLPGPTRLHFARSTAVAPLSLWFLTGAARPSVTNTRATVLRVATAEGLATLHRQREQDEPHHIRAK